MCLSVDKTVLRFMTVLSLGNAMLYIVFMLLEGKS